MSTAENIYNETIDYWNKMEELVDNFIKENKVIPYSQITSIRKKDDPNYYECLTSKGIIIKSLPELIELIVDDFYNQKLDKISLC